MQPRRKLIVFVGLDGSGKSTQAQLLRERLEQTGHRAVYFWARRVPWLLALPVALFKKCLFREPSRSDRAGYVTISRRRQRWLRFRLVRFCWSRTLLLEYAVLLRWRMLRHGRGYEYLIADRYLPDALVDLAASASEPARELRQLQAGLISRLFPRPDALFVIDIVPETGRQRKRDGTSLEYLRDRRPLYRAFAGSSPNAYILDGSQPIAQVAQLARRHLAKLAENKQNA